ncbi:MAG: hypothetical protein OXI08_08510 [Cyanobacteria bacterium MAG IRC4_bin_6]|nr:hypothetical protein [Cyanobacteria bacterium MAG IRC4_bin_6]
MPSWLFPAVRTGGLFLLTGALAVIWAEVKASEGQDRQAVGRIQRRPESQ